MALNLELKIKVDSHSELIEKIIDNGGKFVETLNQKDIYYSFKKGLLKLRVQNGEYELIKYIRNEKEGERWSDYSLLFLKGDNIESYLADVFKIETIVEKDRKLYIYKNTRIHLDNVKELGEFLELETVVKEITQSEARFEFDEVVKFLNLDLNKQIRKSYRDLIIDH